MGCVVLAIGGMPDHLHVFVTFPSTLLLSDLVEQIKGGSSRYVNDTLRPKQFFKWQSHYGAFSVSPHEKQKATNYILNQKRHHAENILWSAAEETSENFVPAQAGTRP